MNSWDYSLKIWGYGDNSLSIFMIYFDNEMFNTNVIYIGSLDT